LAVSDDFEGKLQQQLRDSEQSLDGETLSRLRQIRAQAVEQAGRRTYPYHRYWLPAAAVAAAASVALVIGLREPERPGGPASPPLAAIETEVLEDLALLGSDEPLDLYADLELIEWLDIYGPAG
jgi:hypothetical protein